MVTGQADNPLRRRYKLTIAYDGTDFHGWQKQRPLPGELPLRTVAAVVEEAMVHTLKQPITLVGASRTDAGVHALGQVAHFDAATRIPDDRLAMAIRSRVPADVDIRAAEPVADDFHATRDARCKQYRYRVFNAAARPLAARRCVWPCWWALDVDRMADAAARLVGTHDFAGFAAASHGRLTTVRTIYDCHIESHPIPDSQAQGWPSLGFHDKGARLVDIVVQGDGFLYNMVRIIAGTLVEVGRGHLQPDVIDTVLQSGDRSKAGLTLPPSGLCLEWIRYGETDSCSESRA